jgi:hypothetical protein
MDNRLYNVTSVILSIAGRGEVQIRVRVCNFERAVIFTRGAVYVLSTFTIFYASLSN